MDLKCIKDVQQNVKVNTNNADNNKSKYETNVIILILINSFLYMIKFNQI